MALSNCLSTDNLSIDSKARSSQAGAKDTDSTRGTAPNGIVALIGTTAPTAGALRRSQAIRSWDIGKMAVSSKGTESSPSMFRAQFAKVGSCQAQCGRMAGRRHRVSGVADRECNAQHHTRQQGGTITAQEPPVEAARWRSLVPHNGTPEFAAAFTKDAIPDAFLL